MKQHPRILFLDVDGVLNCELSFRKHRRLMIDPEAVSILNEVVERTGCLVVASSTWRLGFDRNGKDMRENLRDAGFTGEFHDDWRTIDGSRFLPNGVWVSMTRGAEIDEWLSRHPIRGYACLDDETHGDSLTRLVKTDDFDGLKQEHVEPLVALLLEELVTVSSA